MARLELGLIRADLRIAYESSRQLGRSPSTFPGTSSTRKIPETM